MIIETKEDRYKGVIIQLETPQESLMMYQMMMGSYKNMQYLLNEVLTKEYVTTDLTANDMYTFSLEVTDRLLIADKSNPLKLRG